MPAEEQVSITRQSIYATIPVLDIYSAYHIMKLRRYLLVMVLAIVVPQAATEMLFFDGMIDFLVLFTSLLDRGAEHHMQAVYVIMWTAAGIALSVHLIRRWSRQWNEQRA